MTRAKTDCFAYRPGQQKPPRRKAECTALDKLYCRDGECRFYKDKEQQREAEYPKSEYSTPKPSAAAALIRAQGEQLRETVDQYVERIRRNNDIQKSRRI